MPYQTGLPRPSNLVKERYREYSMGTEVNMISPNSQGEANANPARLFMRFLCRAPDVSFFFAETTVTEIILSALE